MDYLIDYEHQSLEPGAVAPAAGWFKGLEWRADGLYVTDARWTEKAKQMITNREYRYISPVFNYDRVTLEVTDLQSVALTNNPALRSLTDLSRVAVNSAVKPGSVAEAPAWTSRDQEVYAHVFGASAETLRARYAQQHAVPPAPAGVSEEDWDYRWRAFGSLLNGK